jgi:hypothetical protein
MSRFIIENPDNPEEVRIDTSQEAMNVAFALALGESPDKYGIDALEAAILIGHIRNFAVEKRNDNLVASCDAARRKIECDVQLIIVQLGG